MIGRLWNWNIHQLRLRGFHAGPVAQGWFGGPSDETLLKRIAKRFGWSETSKPYLKACGHLMYIKVSDEVNYLDFFKHCCLEDTFVSWFTVVELHLWILAARMMHEGEDGRIVRNSMFKALWEDCDVKSKKLEGALASARRRQISELGDQFQATLVGYDEGLQGSDAVLAGALWRRFLHGHGKLDVVRSSEELKRDAMALEMLVIYVRSQYHNLNQLGKGNILRRKFGWDSFNTSLTNVSISQPKNVLHSI